MKFPITKYGLPQVAVFPTAIIVAMALLLTAAPFLDQKWIITGEAILALIMVWVLSFFRDPDRNCPTDSQILLAPADGTVSEIELVEENDFICGKAIKIGIFLSIFNTHINRAPCGVKIEKVTYKKGRYINAMNPESGRVNESNDLWLTRTEEPRDRIIIRQISGAIARRIVCRTTPGDNLAGGERFGMIKFGSRTELYLPARENVKCLINTGDKVKAGLTPLMRYEKCQG
ncbi:MAG: phosphatidylserine decarboxylase [Planctomycetota bacterium]|jgi:phosphatidylserine decarboxylase